MTRKEVLILLILQAQTNGFAFQTWFQMKIEPQCADFQSAIDVLARGQRYYALLFDHDFAQSFWKGGAKIQFMVPASTYTRHDGSGEIITVHRKAYTRRTLKPDAWRYHLREMAATPEPLRYIRRFLLTPEDKAASPRKKV